MTDPDTPSFEDVDAIVDRKEAFRVLAGCRAYDQRTHFAVSLDTFVAEYGRRNADVSPSLVIDVCLTLAAAVAAVAGTPKKYLIGWLAAKLREECDARDIPYDAEGNPHPGEKR